MSGNDGGTWIPAGVFKAWESLRLDSPTWNVLLVMANQFFRYGGTEAHITLRTVAERAKLSFSTVKRSVAKLRGRGLLVKLRQGCWQLTGLNMVSHPKRPEEKRKGLNITNHPMVQHHEPFSILLLSLMEKENNNVAGVPFTPKQMNTLNSVYRQAQELLCGDPLKLTVPDSGDGGTAKTYENWLRDIAGTRSRKEAGTFVGAMLKLLKDERVAGRELK